MKRTASADRVLADAVELVEAAIQKADASERLLKIAQAARRWTCSERTIWRYIKAGKLKPVRLPSGAIRIPLSQLSTRPY